MTMLALRLPPELEARLEALAQKTGRTKSFYAREAIVEHIEDLEDAYLAEERHRTDSGKRISLEEMMEKYAGDLKANP
jgi:RHH-type rel operon transcriptional repressor/antitoxin RelB